MGPLQVAMQDASPPPAHPLGGQRPLAAWFIFLDVLLPPTAGLLPDPGCCWLLPAG